MKYFLTTISLVLLIFFVLALPFIIVTKGLWIPYRLQKSGDIQKEVVEEINSHFHFFVPPLQNVYKITGRINPEFEYVGSNSFFRTLNVGDTIHVFASKEVKAGYCIESNINEFKPPKNILTTMYFFRPAATVFLVILSVAILYTFGNCCSNTKKKIHKDIEVKYNKEGRLGKLVEHTVIINLLVYIFLSISFIYLIIKASFLVEQSGPYSAGFFSLTGTLIGVLSPAWVYWIKSYWDSNKLLLFFIKSVLLLIVGVYSSVKLIKFINEEDISSFENIIDLIFYFFEKLI